MDCAQQQQQRSHVPRFGSWDKDNIPYTAYFENARKEKAGERRMNPNDPKENPEAFTTGPNGRAGDSMGGDVDLSMAKSPLHPTAYRTKTSRESGSHKSITSESSTDKSNSDHSLLQAALQRLKHERKKSDNNMSFSSAGGSRHLREQSATHPSEDDNQRAAASVPKFGAWDESDPKSGQGFTIVFNRVKEEKQIASTIFPPVPNYSHTQVNRPPSNRCRMCCCCWIWRGSK